MRVPARRGRRSSLNLKLVLGAVFDPSSQLRQSNSAAQLRAAPAPDRSGCESIRHPSKKWIDPLGLSRDCGPLL
jgi:hypothetical protein